MEKTFLEDHDQQGFRSVEGYLYRIESGSLQLKRIVRRHTEDPFHNEHPVGRMFHVDMGNVDPGIVFEYIPETQDVRGFVIIIQFLEYAFAELVDDSILMAAISGYSRANFLAR